MRDTGPGIPEEARKRIFNEFEQVEQGPARRYNGTGLGLAISAKLVSLMGDLVSLLGYSVKTAVNATTALDMLRSDATIELLLTDVVMPGGIGGFELAAEARTLRPDLSVVYMSGYAGYSKAEMGEVPARLVRKPSPPSVMAVAIYDALQQPQQ